MRKPIRVIGLAGLALAAAIVLFPPRKAWLPAGSNIRGAEGRSVGYPYRGSRVFLFSDGLYQDTGLYQDSSAPSVGVAAEVDAGRLLAEVVLVGLACGACMVVLRWRSAPAEKS